MRIWWTAIGWMAPLALMLLLITTNVRFTTNSITVYEALFERNNVVARTGITEEGLHQVGRDIQAYFQSDTELLRVSAEVFGVERELFGPDEVSHMYDVKQLFLKTYRVQLISGLFLLAMAGLYAASDRRSALYAYTVWLRRGSLLTVAIVLAIGIASTIAFDAVFNAFHLIGFPQGNFLFDLTTDYLVRVFPFGFWEDITFLIGILSIFEAAVIFGGALLLQRILWGTASEVPDMASIRRVGR
jgi:integral membrane protein (TIGR01906 family)